MLITNTGSAHKSIKARRKPMPTQPTVMSLINTVSMPIMAESAVITRFARTIRYMVRPVSAIWVRGPSPSRQTMADTLLSSVG